MTRGLLLDLLATGNRAGVDAALEHWIELNQGYLDRLVNGMATARSPRDDLPPTVPA